MIADGEEGRSRPLRTGVSSLGWVGVSPRKRGPAPHWTLGDYRGRSTGITAKRLSVLYISYDGMLEPLGQSQVLAYLELLATGCQIHLISFEKPEDFRDRQKVEALRGRMEAAAIRWIPLRYHKSPSVLATSWDVLAGGLLAIFVALRNKIRVIHARSYVAALMALPACRFTSAKLLFDIRGFWVDERVDGGQWRADSSLHRTAKHVEKVLFKSADHIVTLTKASVFEIQCFSFLSGRVPPISIIPTCADLDRFKIGTHSLNDTFVLGYLGSVGSWYLFDEFLLCFKALSKIQPTSRLLIINRTDHQVIRKSIARAGIDPLLVDIQAANHADVAQLVQRMSAGAALIKPTYSKLASAPTKLAEYLGCGVPCLGNAGVGDMTDSRRRRSRDCTA